MDAEEGDRTQNNTNKKKEKMLKDRESKTNSKIWKMGK